MVRFLAALGIMAYHFRFIGVIEGFYAWDVFRPIAFWGELGVDIFFIISGFVILFSAESKKTYAQFLWGRMIRVYPAFIIGSALTMMMGMIMPGTEKKDLLCRWMGSLTLYNKNFLGGGYNLLSSVYWTLMIEIKFYILVAVIKKIGIWRQHKYHLLFLWVSLSLINRFDFQWDWFELWFISEYSGHFATGIILYLFYKGERDKWMLPVTAGSIWLVYRNCVGYMEWIRGIYDQLPYSEADILFAVMIMISFLYFAVYVTVQKQELSRKTAFLGAWSYTVYLVHADFGYFIRTQYYQRLIVWMPWLSEIVNEHIIMSAAVVLSLALSYMVFVISEKGRKVFRCGKI